jgi:hypothetical protein
MITDERKGELLADLEYSVNRYLDKQWVISTAIDNLTENEDEAEFLNSCPAYFSVMLPEEK